VFPAGATIFDFIRERRVQALGLIVLAAIRLGAVAADGLAGRRPVGVHLRSFAVPCLFTPRPAPAGGSASKEASKVLTQISQGDARKTRR
jgi:hypothetical protein